MIQIKASALFNSRPVSDAARRANLRNLYRAGGFLRTTMKRLFRFRKAKVPSEPGTPPRTHTKRLPRSIRFAVDERTGSVVVGPAVQALEIIGQVHEEGLVYRGAQYPARPFKGPALEKARPRLPAPWRDSIR